MPDDLATIFDAKIAELEAADELGKTGVGRFDPLKHEIASRTGIPEDEIYVVGMARPNNFNIRLSQGRAQHRHHRLALGVIHKGVTSDTLDSALNAADPFIGPGNAHHDAIGVVLKIDGKWRLAGLVESASANISGLFTAAFPDVELRTVAAVPAPVPTAQPPTAAAGGQGPAPQPATATPAAPPAQPPKPTDAANIANAFSAALLAAGVSFGADHQDLVRRFLASLLAKPFVILTGLSGSGKSQLAVQLGKWFGEGRWLLVPVRPDWTGPDALLGYENALGAPGEDGQRPWIAPKTLEFILRAARDVSGRPYLLILDEMNLAHVERYFADVLSGMESGTPVIPNLVEERGSWYPIAERPFARLPRNLFIVGTVNVDETTYLFSPKVLDRANTIDFRVPTSALPTDAAAVKKPRSVEEGDEQLLKTIATIAADDSWHLSNLPTDSNAFVGLLHKLHEGLTIGAVEFGHRTLYEGVRLASMLAAVGTTALDDRLDVFVVQKVLPRLHGTRRKLEGILRSLGGFAADLRAPKDAQDFDIASTGTPRLPRSFSKIRRMNDSLRANQFASFAE